MNVPVDWLSPSGATLFRQCPRRWRFRYVDKLPDPAGLDALVGTCAHLVLEHLLQRSPGERTESIARGLAGMLWPRFLADQPDYLALGLDQAQERAFKWRVWRAVMGAWGVIEPTEVDVIATERRVSVTLGGVVPFVGNIDLVHRDSAGFARVDDYKTGKVPAPRYQQAKLDQVLLYAAAVQEIDDVKVRRAGLLFTTAGRVLEIDASRRRVDAAVERHADTWAEIGDACATETFDPTPGPLCAWCPFVDRCPEGMAEVERRAAA